MRKVININIALKYLLLEAIDKKLNKKKSLNLEFKTLII